MLINAYIIAFILAEISITISAIFLIAAGFIGAASLLVSAKGIL